MEMISMCHLLEIVTMSLSQKDKPRRWPQSNPGKLRLLSLGRSGPESGSPLWSDHSSVRQLELLQILPSLWVTEVLKLKASLGPCQTSLDPDTSWNRFSTLS